ncbi:MAG: methylglyoxal synthase [Clostridiales bacterium]|jgi:methylglyoxal synthase|nr:methylglyoxal synthase [Clostridiales bacterium]
MNIGLVAHDNKKVLMENLCLAYRQILSRHTLFATWTTGWLIEENTGLTVSKYLAGHLGGIQQMSVQIAHNDVDLLIYLIDPMLQNHYDEDLNNVLRLCDVHNIPLATNLATAEALLLALDRGDFAWRELVRD